MAIPKKYKKQLKADMKGVDDSKSIQKSKRTWAYKLGDLVEHDGNCCFILDDSRGDGWFELMTSDGRKWVKAKELFLVENLPTKDGGPCK